MKHRGRRHSSAGFAKDLILLIKLFELRGDNNTKSSLQVFIWLPQNPQF